MNLERIRESVGRMQVHNAHKDSGVLNVEVNGGVGIHIRCDAQGRQVDAVMKVTSADDSSRVSDRVGDVGVFVGTDAVSIVMVPMVVNVMMLGNSNKVNNAITRLAHGYVNVAMWTRS